MESHWLLWNHDTWSAISMKRAQWEISWNPLFLIHFMVCDWWIWLSGLSMIGCFPELSDYSQLSDYNCTEWSMKNKTAYAPMISEFGKATRSKSFHVRYTWFNDQTIMRKFSCYSLFNLCVENSFSQNVLLFNFIFYFVKAKVILRRFRTVLITNRCFLIIAVPPQFSSEPPTLSRKPDPWFKAST